MVLAALANPGHGKFLQDHGRKPGCLEDAARLGCQGCPEYQSQNAWYFDRTYRLLSATDYNLIGMWRNGHREVKIQVPCQGAYCIDPEIGHWTCTVPTAGLPIIPWSHANISGSNSRTTVLNIEVTTSTANYDFQDGHQLPYLFDTPP